MQTKEMINYVLLELDYERYIGAIDKIEVSSRRYIYLFLKRVFDVIASSFALILLFPLFLIVAIAIKLEDGGKIIYKQTRVGENKKEFTIYKFRSMHQNAEQRLKELEKLNERDGPAFKITNDPRITRIGKFIRRTCIDELPQLINIIKGDMSLVGPRPPLPNEVEQYSPYHMLRLNVTPGLTCFWQVRKEETTTFDEWVEMDLDYIEKRCCMIDLQIIFSTIKVVLMSKGEG